MNSICVALKRPEEAVQTSIEKSFATIFAHVGPFVGPYVEKAEELFQCALENLDLSGAPNRAGCVVIAELSRHVPSILHKSFYKLSGKTLMMRTNVLEYIFLSFIFLHFFC